MLGGVISSIEPESIADELAWRPGDEIVSINGHPLSDVIDFRFHESDELLNVLVRRNNQTTSLTNGTNATHPVIPNECEESAFGELSKSGFLDCARNNINGPSQAVEFEIEKDPDTPLGVEFADILFDGVRLCGASCIFCFVDQLPRGLRKSLYLKDDDFRLSFLHGNFVTLANATDDDLRRIVTQRLSPLYISVHATDPALRETILGRQAPAILDQIDILAKGRITLHTQIVLCRGINDDQHLDQTIEDLSARHPAVASIAVVPAGIGRHRKNKTPIDAIDAIYSRGILRNVRQQQRRLLEERGTRLVWAADEFYLSAGERVPGAAAYEGFPQLENGVGLVRKFKDSARRILPLLPRVANLLPLPLRERVGVRGESASIVTGELAAPLLREWADSIRTSGLKVNVFPVRNQLLGETVTVAGLISGRDVIDQLRGKDLGEALFVPSVALRDGAFLDDVTIEDVEKALGRPVRAVEPWPYQLVREISLWVAISESPPQN